MHRLIHTFIALAGLGLVLAGCENEYTAYDEAKAANTPEAYEAFLEQFPDGVNVADARSKLEVLDWNAAVEANTAEGYEAYLEKYTEGDHAVKAELEAPKLAWQEVEVAGDIASVKVFLEKYGTTAYAKKANDRIALLEKIPKHLEIGETKLEAQETGKPHLVSAECKNTGEVAIVHTNFRVSFFDAEGTLVKTRRWLLVVEPVEGVDAPKELVTPIEPGDTRTFSYDFSNKEAGEGWTGDVAQIHLEVVELKLAGEK